MVSSTRALRVLLVGLRADSVLPARLTTVGWAWEHLSLDSWFVSPGALAMDAALIDLSEPPSSDTWLRIHHLVPRVPYPLVLVTDGPLPSSFHYPRAGGLRVALLPTAPHPDLLRSTISLARQNYQMVRLAPDPDWQGGDSERERREVLMASVRRMQQELEAVQALVAPPGAESGPVQVLGEREWQVRDLLLKGLSIGVIADSLGIAESTVKKHIHSIYRKRGVSNRAQLMAGG